MPLTLRSMLAMEVLATGRPEVLAGEDRLDRVVRWVHVTEVDDVADLLGGHEVVLTTGLPLVASTTDPARFVSQLARADACGLIVELGSRLPHVPAEIIAEAERLHLPLIALNSPVKFVSITETVHRLIVGEQYQGLEFAQRTHEVFTDLSLDTADASAIVRAASELIDAPVVLEDAGHHVVALADHGQTSRVLLRDWEERSRRAEMLEEPGTSGPEDWLTCPVGLRGSPWGRLVAPALAGDPVSTAMVMQRAAQALQLSRLVERDTSSLHFQAQQSFLQDLMDGHVQNESDGLARARALGLEDAPVYLPVVAQFEPSPVSDQLATQRRARTYLEIVSAALRKAKISAVAGGMGDDHVGLIVALRRGSEEESAMESLVRALTPSHHSRSQIPSPVIGVGRPATGLLVAASRMRTTTHIAEAGRALQPSTLAWFRSTDVRLRGLVAQLQDDERVLGFAESELAPLLALGAEESAGLLALLRSYVDLRGNKVAVAQANHMSRQALYGRLRKLEAILQMDLDDTDSYMSLAVALLVHDIRQTGNARPRQRP